MKAYQRFPTLIFVICFLISACSNDSQTPTSTPPIDVTQAATPGTDITPIPLKVGYGVKGSWFELYFTDPASPFSSQITGGVDGPLSDAIDSARLSIDVAIYSLSLDSIRYALINAHKRGVQVRMVMESDNMKDSDPRALIDAGISIVGDKRRGLMHDKFMVVDRREVWTGSMNYTNSGGYEDNNNLIRINSDKVATDYTKEFEEMFLDNKFGPDVVPETPFPDVTLDGTQLQIYFSPDDKVLSRLLPLLNNAKHSIYFLAFSFTTNELGDAVRAKAAEGLKVKGVMDADQVKSNAGTEYDPFLQAGVDVRKDGNKGLMHHKVMIIDGAIVVLGSYNFTASAETRNDENIVIIYNKTIAEQFMQEFERVWAQVPK